MSWPEAAVSIVGMVCLLFAAKYYFDFLRKL